ncbi:hypothetical protein JVT61DRAFT_2346 [Boletus reticuloceps]|uniref:Uncharacterized protein n=1 Tax=Boletus reticuloceps TaxID=495285 RepID=A0A8I2YR72_9AGAM|nr:hypothetical protein JVT61DRAFT_2346 [Boletus reticuloceps]
MYAPTLVRLVPHTPNLLDRSTHVRLVPLLTSRNRLPFCDLRSITKRTQVAEKGYRDPTERTSIVSQQGIRYGPSPRAVCAYEPQREATLGRRTRSKQQRQDKLEPEIHPNTGGSIASYSPARGTPHLQSTRAVRARIHDRQTWQYAYHGEDNSRVGPSYPTNGQQSASVRQPQLLHINHGMMAPPPPPSQGKRSRAATARLQIEQSMETAMSQDLGPQRTTEISDSMGPPPTPQRPFSAAPRTSSRVPTHNATHQTSSALQTNRFIPSSSHNRTFSGFTPAVTSTGTTPAGNVGKASGGNRMPFMPQSSSGFRR